VLANPYTFIEVHQIEVRDLVDASRDWLANYLDHQTKDIEHLRRLAVSLSPQSTLDRGYSVVRDLDGNVLRDAAKVKSGSKFKVRLAKGEVQATAD
jgi:exodeoxyribonuclease VII large subunit